MPIYKGKILRWIWDKANKVHNRNAIKFSNMVKLKFWQIKNEKMLYTIKLFQALMII